MNDVAQVTEDCGLSADAVFEILSHNHRRILLRDLQTYDQPQAVADLAKVIVKEQDDVSQISADVLQRIQISLHHLHLPKLEEADLITINQEQNTATLTTRGKRIGEWIEENAG